ncbi:LysE family translocator [Marinomonas mediterranea]|jgi:Putative threonine efflux protein|uniref:Lysine exporter protein (LYSE/YGGA) n=1 Tax=Marinomonas mediterranea (strain ATCC 700492 / JCM 21426 / NBRC 103028 / MMB-1) TaxID=717774 RepID=F2K467_MARM1|nr:LysE family translocator [Marinomonas mediterranea]ADZ92508.1 Lysine exporter protein (LYSE/YGGA) [Marinomonas mediterranea MMB-1]WCN10454.1 LysE family transporter [Marinomonas mediterranea]WCN14502.1 LysE family transporter [Marinomonas mediterranea]WCN18553.1 LysE family transporter [Marinomonas mediterranea MMB-1]
MSIESAITFSIAVFIFSITPGPGVFAIIARSMAFGARSAIPLSAGMALGDIAYLIMACFGLATIATRWEEVFLAIRFIGAAYLIYLGWKMWTSSSQSIDNEQKASTSREPMFKGMLQGFAISSSNPKVVLFYIAFLPTFLDVTALSAQDVAITSVLAYIALMLGLSLIAYSASQARRLMKTQRAQQRLNRGAGSIMIGAGAFLALKN